MAAQSIRIAGRQFVLIPEREYERLKQSAGRKKSETGRTGERRVAPAALPPVEIYSDRRIAEFLLSNSVNADDYARACDDVRKMGLDPATIPHTKPPGV